MATQPPISVPQPDPGLARYVLRGGVPVGIEVWTGETWVQVRHVKAVYPVQYEPNLLTVASIIIGRVAPGQGG